MRRKPKTKTSSQNRVNIANNSYGTTIQKALGFSRSQIVKLRYCEQVTLSPNTTNNAYISYAANGPFSPYIGSSATTGHSVAHQPKGWDQWTAIYNEYIVLDCDLSCTASPPNSTNPTSAGGLLLVHLSDSSTAYTTATSAIEDGKAIYKQFNPNTSQGPCVVRHKFNSLKFWDLKDLRDNQKQYGAVVSANPSELAYFHVEFFANDPSITTTVGPLLWVVLDYTILLTGPADLTQS